MGKRSPGGVFGSTGAGLAIQTDLQPGDVGGLRALRAALDGELDLLAFTQAAEAFTLNGREVNEDVGTFLRGDEAVALGVVEPLDGASGSILHLWCTSFPLIFCRAESVHRSP